MDLGTAVGVISLGVQVCSGLVSYYAAYKSCYQDVDKTIKRIQVLLNSLQSLEAAVHRLPRSRSGESDESLNVIICVSRCRSSIETLRIELDDIQKIQLGEVKGSWQKFQAKSKRLLYPFKESTLAKLREAVFEAQDDLGPSLDALNLHIMGDIHFDVKDIQSLLASTHKQNLDREVQRKLLAPDPGPKLHKA